MDWNDITQSFRSACQKLEVGELCHNRLFSLTEAMCAIELMDPKMDLSVQIKRPVLNVNQAILKGSMQMKKINLSEMLGIMDETWAAFVTWLDGENLVETVFINMYLLKPTAIENPYLRAFAIGMINFISCVRSRIVQAATYEEEDFCHLFPSHLSVEVSETRVTGMLKEASEELNRHCRQLRARQSSADSTRSSQSTTSTTPYLDGTEPPELVAAVGVRLRLLRCLLLSFQQVARLVGEAGGSGDLGPARTDLRKYLGSAVELLTEMRATLGLGQPGSECGRANPREHPYGLMGFEAFANLAQMPPSIPRHARIRGREEAVTELQAITHRLQAVLDIVSVDPNTDCHQVWYEIQQYGQIGVDGRSCLLSRSLLHLLYVSPTNGRVMGRLLKQQVFLSSLRHFLDLSDWGAVERAMRSKSLTGAVDDLVRACADHLFDFPATYAYNRSRQRNRITVLVDTLWDLYEECHRVDYAIKEALLECDMTRKAYMAIFTPYIAYFIFQLMWDYVTVGFELDLYAPHEYPYVYFFLSETVFYYFLVQMTDLEQSQIVDKGTVRSGSKKNRRANCKEDEHVSKLSPLVLNLKTHYHLASGTLTAFCALLKDGKFGHTTQLTFGSEETRYQHRFAPLLNKGWLGNCGVYMRYRSSWDTRLRQPTSKLYTEAFRCFDAARARLQQDCENQTSVPAFGPCSKYSATTSRTENENLLRLAKNNMVVMKILSSGAKADAEVVPDFNVARKHYPMFKLS